MIDSNPPPGYRVASADLDRHRHAIVGVWARNFPAYDHAAHERRFDWYYLQNPWGRARCLILVHEASGQVVGTAGVGPRRFWLGNRLVNAGVASDFAVDKEHRTSLPALSLQRGIQGFLDTDFDLLYATPNPKSMPHFRRLGYEIVSAMQRWVKVLRVERYLRQRRWLKPWTPVLAPMMNAARRLVSREPSVHLGNFRLVPRKAMDERIDALWARRPKVELQGERSAAFFNWRFGRAPMPSYEMLVLQQGDQDRIHGYAAGYRTREDEWHVVDGMVEGIPPEMLVAGVIHHARELGCASVSWTGTASAVDPVLMKRFGFAERPGGLQIVVSCRPGLDLDAEQLRRWRFTLADEDYN